MDTSEIPDPEINPTKETLVDHKLDMPDRTIAEAEDMIVDGAEVLLDSVLSDGILRDIPMIGTAVGIIKLGYGISDYLKLKKLYLFQKNLHEIDEESKQKFLNRLSDDNSFSEEVGTNLLLLIDRMENIRKPKLLAYAFSAFVEEKIDKHEYDRFCFVIDRIDYSTLPFLINLNSIFDQKSSQEYWHFRENYDQIGHLSALGLLTLPDGSNQYEGSTFEMTAFGKRFIDIVLANPKDSYPDTLAT